MKCVNTPKTLLQTIKSLLFKKPPYGLHKGSGQPSDQHLAKNLGTICPKMLQKTRNLYAEALQVRRFDQMFGHVFDQMFGTTVFGEREETIIQCAVLPGLRKTS